ncbi:MAG: enoyl-CoA hydratase/isomerase family protein [Acidobacteria bacterium]|nr:enoyl-CoA hydratase/isomerase family protein [Acidobacteriota bacterium]
MTEVNVNPSVYPDYPDCSGQVWSSRRGQIASVKFNRARAGRTLDAGVIAKLQDEFNGLRDDPEIRAVILTGAGRHDFSMRADDKSLSALSSELALKFVRDFQKLTSTIEDLGKPVIAAIDGDACGIGLDLALCCTWRIAVSDSMFSRPGIGSGLMPGFGGLTRLAGLAGRSRALELVLTGEPIGAEKALSLNLINKITDTPEEMLEHCERLAARLSSLAPLAIRYALETVNKGAQMSLEQGLLLESALFGICFSTSDVKEGTTAFLEKRAPDFKGE